MAQVTLGGNPVHTSGDLPAVGAAAAGSVVDRVEAAFTAQGFAVARNAPFAGAYITQAYGRPTRGQHESGRV